MAEKQMHYLLPNNQGSEALTCSKCSQTNSCKALSSCSLFQTEDLRSDG